MQNYDGLIDTLNKKGFHAEYFKDAADAKERVLQLTEDADTIGIGGSVTLQEAGILDALEGTGKQLFSRVLENKKENPDMLGMWKKATFCDCYITSTNALTLEGDLVNIDGNGNRAAAMFFGPKKVVVVCGTNKIVKDPLMAVERIKNIAAPKNAKRLGLSTPCAKTGKCIDCNHPQRMCRTVVRMQYPSKFIEVHVLLVGAALGY